MNLTDIIMPLANKKKSAALPAVEQDCFCLSRICA